MRSAGLTQTAHTAQSLLADLACDGTGRHTYGCRGLQKLMSCSSSDSDVSGSCLMSAGPAAGFSGLTGWRPEH